MRIWTSIKLIILGLVLIGAGLTYERVLLYIAPEHLRQMLLAEFARSVNGTLQVQRASLDVQGNVHIEDVSLTPPGGDKPLFECPRVEVGVRAGFLLKGKVIPDKVALRSPIIRLTYSREQNAWNFQALTLLQAAAKAPAAPARPGAKAPTGLLQQGISVENATLMVSYGRLFDDDLVRTYEGLYVTVTPDSAGVWHFDGSGLRGSMAGVRFSGWYIPGPQPQFNVRFSNDILPVDRAFWYTVPYGPGIWDDFQLAGTMSVSGELNLDEHGKLNYSLDAGMHDATALTKYFAFPVHSVSGGVVVSNGGIVLKDITGVAPAEELGGGGAGANPVHVRVSGVDGRENGSYLYAIQASDLPLSERAISAIPDVGPEIWQRLRPDGGTCQMSLTLSRPQQGAHTRFRAEIGIRAATLRPPEIPMPLRQVNGTIIVDNDALQFQNLSGVVQQDLAEGASTAYFTVQGLADLHKKESSLDVSFQNVRTTEELIKAIPRSGDAIWRTAQPQVALDGRLLVGNGADGELTVRSALLDIHGGNGQLDFWPLPLHDLSGTLKLTGSDLQIERLDASIHLGTAWDQNLPESSRLTVQGLVNLKANSADVHIDGRDMVLCEELLRTIPVVGNQIWQEARPVGVAAVSGQIIYKGGQDHPLRCFLDVDLQDVAMELKLLKTPLDAVAGHVLVTEQQAFSNDFSALICGGRLTGRAVVYYPHEEKYPRYSASGSFEKVDLAKLARRLTGKEQQMVGQISGWVDMGGVYGQEGSLAANGHLALVDGHLLHIPLFAQLLTVLRLNLPEQEKADQEGQLDFSRGAGKVTIREFELNGAGLSLSGYGTIGFDESLNLTMIAVGAPTRGGIPVISSLLDWLLKGLERQLVRVDVTGTLSKPQFSQQVLSTITWPLRSLRTLLSTPILGSSAPEAGK